MKLIFLRGIENDHGAELQFVNKVCDHNLSHDRALWLKITLVCFKDHLESTPFHPARQQAMTVSNGASSGTTMYSRSMIRFIAVCSIQRATPIRFQPTLGTLLVICGFLCMEPCCCTTIPHKCGICHLLCRCTHIIPMC